MYTQQSSLSDRRADIGTHRPDPTSSSDGFSFQLPFENKIVADDAAGLKDRLHLSQSAADLKENLSKEPPFLPIQAPPVNSNLATPETLISN